MISKNRPSLQLRVLPVRFNRPFFSSEQKNTGEDSGCRLRCWCWSCSTLAMFVGEDTWLEILRHFCWWSHWNLLEIYFTWVLFWFNMFSADFDRIEDLNHVSKVAFRRDWSWFSGKHLAVAFDLFYETKANISWQINHYLPINGPSTAWQPQPFDIIVFIKPYILSKFDCEVNKSTQCWQHITGFSPGQIPSLLHVILWEVSSKIGQWGTDIVRLLENVNYVWSHRLRRNYKNPTKNACLHERTSLCQ